jgi:hypothetical protein
VIGRTPAALARQRDWPYLKLTDRRTAATPSRRMFTPMVAKRMAQPVSTPRAMPLRPARKVAAAIVVGAAVLGAAALSGALLLWFHYGTAVFFEMITSGIAACF